MRRRKTETIEDLSTNQTDPIDEDDQEKIVNELRLQAADYSRHVGLGVSMFSTFTAAFTCLPLLYSFLRSNYGDENRLLETSESDILFFLSVMYSTLIHFFAIWIGNSYVANLHLNEETVQMIGISAVSLPLLVFFFTPLYNELDVFHLSPAIGNVCSMSIAVFFRRDVVSTFNSVEELEKSVYHFKSI